MMRISDSKDYINTENGMVSSTFLKAERACFYLLSFCQTFSMYFLTKVNKDIVPENPDWFRTSGFSSVWRRRRRFQWSIGIRQWRKILNLLQNLMQRLVKVKPKWIHRIIQDKRNQKELKTKQTNIKLKLVSTSKKHETQSCSGL